MEFLKFDDSRKFIFERAENNGKEASIHPKQHYHNLFEIYYLESGSCNYFIDNKSYNVVPGDLVLIPEGVIHNTLYDDNEPHTRLLINCSAGFIPASVASSMQSMIYLYRNPDISGQICDILRSIEEETIKNDEFSGDILRCHTHMLFFLLARNRNKYTNINSSSAYIEEIIKNIQSDFASEITLSATAKQYSISPEHLSRTFKKETGFGFLEYVTIIRLRQAELMLVGSRDTSISDVAYSCGFNDSNYFSQIFKKFYGFSPSKLKKGRS